MKLWIARNSTGELWLFNEKPYVKENCYREKYWWVDETEFMYSSLAITDDDVYPEVTFENSPIEVELVIKK